eukprot:CAMPEP_0172700684 /NCGR_PEP_ID=MMETSP1074-20121228/31080_1 /TAXON_ID=2916 /ORGANISM="Ceratium fusus, Strain PA161109" /LENGTH=861 /DNA_ID=CAMNT_0013522109 /DNA_START=170 /DNA_END=2753 /DNA_ORIENTATION=-
MIADCSWKSAATRQPPRVAQGRGASNVRRSCGGGYAGGAGQGQWRARNRVATRILAARRAGIMDGGVPVYYDSDGEERVDITKLERQHSVGTILTAIVGGPSRSLTALHVAEACKQRDRLQQRAQSAPNFLTRNRSRESLHSQRLEEKKRFIFQHGLQRAIRTDAAIAHRRDFAEEAYERSLLARSRDTASTVQVATVTAPSLLCSMAANKSGRSAASSGTLLVPTKEMSVCQHDGAEEGQDQDEEEEEAQEMVEVSSDDEEEDDMKAYGPCFWRKPNQFDPHEARQEDCGTSRPSSACAQAVRYRQQGGQQVATQSLPLLLSRSLPVMQLLTIALGGQDALCSLSADHVWDSVISVARVMRFLRWQVRRFRAAKVIRWTLRHAPRFFEVRFAYRKRSAAARQLQRTWRGFGTRIRLLVQTMLQGPWRKHEASYLEELFTVCPLDSDVVVEDWSLLCGEVVLGRDSSPVARVARGNASHVQRWQPTLSCAKRRPTFVSATARRKQQDDKLYEMMRMSFQKHVKRRVGTHRFQHTTAARLLRREIIERLYDHCQRGILPRVTWLGIDCLASATTAAALSSSLRRVPPSVVMNNEDMLEMVLCAHCRCGVRPSRSEECARFFNACQPWRLGAVTDILAGKRTIRAGLLDRWSSNHSSPANDKEVTSATSPDTTRAAVGDKDAKAAVWLPDAPLGTALHAPNLVPLPPGIRCSTSAPHSRGFSDPVQSKATLHHCTSCASLSSAVQSGRGTAGRGLPRSAGKRQCSSTSDRLPQQDITDEARGGASRASFVLHLKQCRSSGALLNAASGSARGSSSAVSGFLQRPSSSLPPFLDKPPDPPVQALQLQAAVCCAAFPHYQEASSS